MHKVIVCFIALGAFFLLAMSPVKKKEKLSWMNLQEAEASFKNEKKPILIDLYTDWCGWCKEMDKKTYSDKNVIGYVLDKFYPVKLNAETREVLAWSGRSFKFNPSNRTNDFAIYLTQGRLSYPTTVIIPADGSEPQAIPGYLTPNEIEIILKYFGDGYYGKISFDEYQKRFKPSW